MFLTRITTRRGVADPMFAHQPPSLFDRGSKLTLRVWGLCLALSIGCSDASDHDAASMTQGGSAGRGTAGGAAGSGGSGGTTAGSSGQGGGAGTGGTGGSVGGAAAQGGTSAGAGMSGAGSGGNGAVVGASGAGAGRGGASAGAGGASAGAGGASAGAGGASAGAGGASAGAGGASAGAGGASAGAGGDGVTKSSGCDDGTHTLESADITVQSGGASRTYTQRIPDDYDDSHPYRLILGFHGANGNSKQVAPSYFGLWSLSEGSTIFIAPNAAGGLWSSTTDVTFVDDILAQVKDDLCIDTTRIELEGFSQGGAMAWTLAGARPNVFRAAVVHSGGGLSRPASIMPIAFMSSLGQEESNGAGQTSNSDFFAMQNGCTVATLPKAPAGGHVCSNYDGCSAGHPTRWCDYDGGHTPAPTDSGQSMSFMPQEVWTFLSQF
jgi:poly(3-hydroxybutyrate) depolymerase